MPSRRQEALAELEATAPPETPKVELLRRAGYAETTALASAKRALESAGTQRASEALAKRKRDSARSWRSDGEKLLKKAVEKADTLHPIEQVQAGVALVKLSMEAGEVPDAAGSLDRWKRFKRTLYRRAFRAGFRAALEGRDPLGLVVSQLEASHNLERPPETPTQVIETAAVESK